MGKYPVDITDEVNAKLRYPFLTRENYDEITRNAVGPTVLIRHEGHLSQEDIRQIIQINQRIAVRKRFSKQPEANGDEEK